MVSTIRPKSFVADNALANMIWYSPDHSCETVAVGSGFV
jgi:hypothetical protein